MDNIRESRLDGLESTINYYEYLCKSGHKLSDEQRKQLREVSNCVACFGEYGKFLHEIAEELLVA